MTTPVDSRSSEMGERLSEASRMLEQWGKYEPAAWVRGAILEIASLQRSLTARDAALLQAQRDLQDCHMAFLNNIKSPAAHDRYAGIAERGIEAIGAALSKEAPK